MSGELQQWKALRSTITAADTAIDLTTSGRDEAGFGVKPATTKNLWSGELFGKADLNGLALELIFFGLSSNNDSNVVTLYSWRENGPCEIICVLTLTTGQLLAVTDPTNLNATLGTGANYRYVDTIVMTTNHANVAYEIMDSAADRVAKVRVPLDGRRWWYAEVTTLNSTNITVASSLVGKCTSTTMLNPSFDIGDVNLLNSSGTVINPATEDKQDTAAALLKLTPIDEQAVVLSVTTSNQTETVLALTVSYILSAVDGTIYAGFNATVATPANRAWVIPAGQSRLITMLADETTLNYIGDANCTGYLQKVVNT